MRCLLVLFPDDPLSADIRLETESDEGSEPQQVPPDVYHPRHALRMALREWLPEFNKARTAPSVLQQRVLTITPGALEGPGENNGYWLDGQVVLMIPNRVGAMD